MGKLDWFLDEYAIPRLFFHGDWTVAAVEYRIRVDFVSWQAIMTDEILFLDFLR